MVAVVRKVKSRIRKALVRFYRYYTLKVMYPHLYRRCAGKPVDEGKVVFVEVRMTALSDNFSLIYDRLNKQYCYTIHTHFLRMGFVRKLEYIRLCRAMIQDIADAKYVFLNDSSDVMSCLPLRRETVLTQLWHACGAFKKFGMSTADLIFGDDRKTLMKYPYHGNYTHVTVSAPEVIWAYEEAMSLEKNGGIVKAAGISRTDVFFDERFITRAYQTLYERFPAAKGRKVILYAPTFRGRVAKANTPDELDIGMMYRALSADYVLILKHHPFVKRRPEIPEAYRDFAADMTQDMSIEDLLCVSDICISDYSSLVFEYSLFERPMLFFAYDLDEYFDWRGFYYEYETFVPGPVYTETAEITDYIRHVDERFDRQRVVSFREKFMSACDGQATDRIMRLVFGDSLNRYCSRRS